MMLAFLLASIMSAQIALDREGFSPNAIDGVWGSKSKKALAHYCVREKTALADAGELMAEYVAATPFFRADRVTREELDSLVAIPKDPAEKAKLALMGYSTIAEMYAERGHLSVAALKRLNPKVDFDRVKAGTVIVIPDFPSIGEELSVWPKGRYGAPVRPEAALVRISLSRFEVTAFDAAGKLLAAFPCSIAADKAKLPEKRELKITTAIANPNYTYTPDRPDASGRKPRYVWPAGPNCPVGVAWLGLDLPGYGIHGTPTPESIGRAESHGCFRLANWNAARLYALVKPGVRVLIDE